MTNREWRRWGHLSKLGRITAGPSSAQVNAENTQTEVSQAQLQLAQTEEQQSQQQYQQMQALEAPYIAQQQALASGDKGAAISAAMPTISALSSGFQASKEQILNNIPPGPGRDAALAQLQTQSALQPQLAVAQQIQQAPAALANVGAGLGSFSLQQVGAALSGYTGANTSAGQVASEEAAAQANKVGLISGLAGAAGTAAGGIFGGKSDRRLKENIKPLHRALDKILHAEIVRFDYRVGKRDQIGVIAQDVARLFPEVTTMDLDGYYSVNYGALAAVALRGIQELSQRVAELEAKLEEARHGVAAEA